MDWREYISANPNVCHGRACIKGTRVMVSVILDNLAERLRYEDIMESYPSLSPEAIQASVAYGAELAKERVVALPA